ncbi:MAG: hypothetical protein EZS28_001464, partial [Streblomastix strix]
CAFTENRQNSQDKGYRKKVNFNSVIFSEEKKFKLDGPDCYNYF